MSRPATSRLKVNPPLGLRPSLENCRIGDLNIDAEYQRSTEGGSSQALIRRIAMFWDWSLFHPLALSRRGDGSLWVVDGQHRLAAARLRGDIYDLPCVVSSYASAADEAASFVAMNVQRRPLSALDLFRAAQAASDDQAEAIATLLDRADLTLAPHMNHISWKPGMVSNIGGIQRCFKAHGKDMTGRALLALSRGFEGQVLRYCGTIFGGIARWLGRIGNEVDFELLVMVLSGATQAEWMQEIKNERAATDKKWDIAAGAVLRRAYDEAAGE